MFCGLCGLVEKDKTLNLRKLPLVFSVFPSHCTTLPGIPSHMPQFPGSLPCCVWLAAGVVWDLKYIKNQKRSVWNYVVWLYVIYIHLSFLHVCRSEDFLGAKKNVHCKFQQSPLSQGAGLEPATPEGSAASGASTPPSSAVVPVGSYPPMAVRAPMAQVDGMGNVKGWKQLDSKEWEENGQRMEEDFMKPKSCFHWR